MRFDAVSSLVLCAIAPGGASPRQQPGGAAAAAAQDGFVPVDQLPAPEQLPAAPLVIAAYAFAWVAVLVLRLWSIWRRLDRVERELREVIGRLERGGRR